MNTPILTELQQKKALSGKKKSKKLTVKNVLSTPYANYWPLLTDEDASTLTQVLNQHLLLMKQPKVYIPWSELKTIPREQKKAFRLDRLKENSGSGCEHYNNNKSDIVFGINQTARSLETDTASSILIASDVNPQLMVKHVIDMAVLKNIPVVVVPNLKDLLREKIGYSSTTVTFKKIENIVGANYWAIDQKIKEIYSNYPVPLNHINYHRRDGVEEELAMDVNEVESGNDEVKQCRDLYLYRKTKLERVFVPEVSREHVDTSSVIKMQIDSGGFLGFNDYDDSVIEGPVLKKSKTKVSYKSLLVKRITNNKDRDKKKIQLLKNRR